MFDKYGQETLQRAVDGAMNDYRFFAAIFPIVVQIKSFGQLSVELNGAALPGSSQTIFDMKIDLWSVESTFPFAMAIA